MLQIGEEIDISEKMVDITIAEGKCINDISNMIHRYIIVLYLNRNQQRFM